MADSSIEICNRALVLVRAATIDQFDNISQGSSTEEIVCKTLYESQVQAALSKMPWSFSTTSDQLSRLIQAPEHVWDAAYQKPDFSLHIQSVQVNGMDIDYEIQEDNILCNALESDEVYCDYTFRADEAVWPPYFKQYLYFKLAALFAIPCGGQETIATHYTNLAEVEFRLAKNMDSQADTAERVTPRRLTGARRGV